MRSSSPKLNFFIKTPVPTATAAAGVESFKSQLSMFSKAEFILDTNLGSPKANTECSKIKNKMIENKIVNKIKNVIFFNLIIKTPFNNKNKLLCLCAQGGVLTFFEIIKAILMGIVEGITEWLPISSTGHMILVEQVVKFNASEEFMSMFRVVIQLGAILAVVVLFWNKLWPFGLRQGKVISKPSVWNLWFKVVAATLPVLVISPLDDWMEEHFYNYITVAAMLILYGVLFLVVENRRTTPRVTRLEQISYRDALLIGVWQCLAIIPGTSRSGATIVGGLLLGLSRACVAEFTFYLAIPVMAGASLLKVVKFAVSGVSITGTEIAVLLVGCVVAFVVSLAAIRFLMDYVKRHDFKFFGIYRIVLGAIVLAVAAITALA